MKFIIYNPKTELFNFFVNAFIEHLNNKNINNDIYNNINIYNYDKDIILILINPHFIFDYINIKNEIYNISNIFKYKILYLSEPINFMVEKKVYLDLIKIIKPYCLWTYTSDNFNKLNTYLNIFKIIPKYNNSYSLTNININKNSDNIIFFGNINQNRLDICNQFNTYLINKTNTWTISDWTEVLNNNLFYLNIHRRVGCKSFEAFRIIPILANGGVVFSERCNNIDEEEYKDYNIIFVEKNNLYNTFINYKNNIDYNIINKKTLLFRENMLIDKEFDKYIKYFIYNYH
jgi:hypothetical protein